MRILLSGASGLIGTALRARLLERGHELRILVRREPEAENEVRWDPAGGMLPAGALDRVDAVVNLSGASIGRLPWTAAYRRELLSSRIDATRTLVEAIAAAPVAPRILLNASASGFYGSRPGESLDESSPVGDGFLAELTAAWEAEALGASEHCVVVLARTGIVLHPRGALAPLITLSRLGVAGPIGGGTNAWPWVSLEDEVEALAHLLESTVTGPVNIVAPAPATAAEIGRALARRLRRPYWLPAPAVAVRALLREAAEDLILVDQRIDPAVLRADGFAFRHRSPEAAIAAAIPAP